MAAAVILALTTEADADRADRLAELEAAVHSLHSYDTPEWLHWPAGAGAAYGQWLQQSCDTEAEAMDPGPVT